MLGQKMNTLVVAIFFSHMSSPILTNTLTQISYILQDTLNKATYEPKHNEYIANLLKTIADQAIRINKLENDLDNYKLQTTIQAQAIADLEKRITNLQITKN
jgi:adenine-specific DNA methylase